MLDAAKLVRLDSGEIALLEKYRLCTKDRQDVLQHIADQLARQTQAEIPKTGNVVLLTGRKLS